MPAADSIFGYLACLEDPRLGVTGGYLIVSATGRPLEFHCTEPVQANRAQEILFGPTLRPHLFGERIGATLVGRAKLSPDVLAIADADLLAAGKQPKTTVLFPENDAPPLGSWTPLSNLTDAQAWSPVDAPAEGLVERLARLAESIELTEPFERIREAIREAQRIGQHGAPARDAA